MQAPETHKASLQRKAKTRIAKWLLALAVALIALVVFLVPAFVSSEKGRKIILAKINDCIDGEIDFGNLTMNWRKGIKIIDFGFNDSAGRTIVEVKQIVTKPRYGSILLGSLSFGETMINDIQINDETTKRFLMYLNPVFANAVNVSGVANFSCERFAMPLSGASQNDIEVTGTISINQLRLEASDLLGQILSLVGAGFRGQDITIHPTRFVLQNGFIRYDDMQMDVGNHPVVFGGVIGLDKSLNMTVILPYTTRGRTVRVGEKKISERIKLALKGSIDKPELDVSKLLEEQLKEQLKQRLLEGLDRLLK